MDDIKRIALKNGIETIISKFKEETKEVLDAYEAKDISNLQEEVVDTMIMCEQIIAHYGFNKDALNTIREFKINRTKERLGIEDGL